MTFRVNDLVFVKGMVTRFDDHVYPLVEVGVGFAHRVSISRHDVLLRTDTEPAGKLLALRMAANKCLASHEDIGCSCDGCRALREAVMNGAL